MAEPERQDGDAELVESGSFRVDRARMLEKLAKFQLGDPSRFLLCWLRCAVASGARSVSVTEFRRPWWGLELRFDGRPFSREELEEPYGCLLGEQDLGGRRNRELAYGLLAALRTRPDHLRISSGHDKARLQSTIYSLSEVPAVAPADPLEKMTVLRAAWSRPPEALREGGWLPDDPERRPLLEEYPLPLSVNNREVPRRRALGTRALGFNEGPVYGRIERARGYPPFRSRVGLHCLGVLVDTIVMEYPDAQASGFIDDDAFALDASQSAVVRDSRFMAAMSRVTQAVHELLERELEMQRERMPLTGKALRDPKLLERWAARLDSEDAWTRARLGPAGVLQPWLPEPLLRLAWGPFSRRAPTPELEALSEDGLRTVWLRDAASRALKDLRDEPSDPAGKALRAAPLLFDSRGGGMSLAEVQALFARRGRVPVRESLPDEARGEERAVWLTSPKDSEFLSRWFKGGLAARGSD